MTKYLVMVEYYVEAPDEEAAVEAVRSQLYADDDYAQNHGEERLDYIVRSVR